MKALESFFFFGDSQKLYLYIDGMVIFPVDILELFIHRSLNTNVCAINAPEDIRESLQVHKFQLLPISSCLTWKANPVVHSLQQGPGHPCDRFAGRALWNADQLAANVLKRAGRVKSECQQHLQNWVQCSSPVGKLQQVSDFSHDLNNYLPSEPELSV